MKIVVLGDIHGRPFWREIVEKESPDVTIFLGDYVTTHELYTPEQQLTELKAILDYKEQNPGSVVLLRGNHDLDGLGYYWAACYPDARDIQPEMAADKPLGQRFLKNTQWLCGMDVADKPTLFAHAGVSQEWLSKILGIKDKFDLSVLHEINSMEPSEKFGFCGDRWDHSGTDPQQSCTWIRPNTLAEHHVPGWDQVVGHTGTYGKCTSRPMDGDVLWMCDALQQKSYLVIEDNKYIIKEL